MSISSFLIESLITLAYAIGVLGALAWFSKLVPTFSKGLKYYSLLGIAAFLTLFAHSANLIEHTFDSKNTALHGSVMFSNSVSQHLTISGENGEADQKNGLLFFENDEEDNWLSIRKLLQKHCSILHTVYVQSGLIFEDSAPVRSADSLIINVHTNDQYLNFIQVYRI